MNAIGRRGIGSVMGLALAAFLLASLAYAASLAVAGRSIGAGQAEVAPCTSAALSILQTVGTTTVTSVVVAGFPSTCGGASVLATVNNGTASSGGSATVPAGGGSVTVTLATAVAVAGTDAIEVLVTGP